MLDEKTHNKLIALTELELKLKNGEGTRDEYYKQFKELVLETDAGFHNSDLIHIKKHIRFSKFPKHRHNFIEITYVYRGKMNQNIEGKEVTLKKGELIFLNQKIVHEIGMTGEEDVILNFIISPKFLDYILNLLKNENIISKFLLSTIYSGTIHGEYLLFHVAEIETIQKIIEDIIEEMYNKNMTSNVKIQLLMGLLIVELLNNTDCIESYSEKKYDKKLITDVLKYIDENYKTASLKEISDYLNQPDYQISRMIKNITGLTFKMLLQEKKLEKATYFLKNTNFSIEDIIKNVGYENATYFYKIFKKKYNMSLKEFRDNYLKKN